ncbi:MAG: ribosome-associated translation inhibitor RaiA [Proteobacteria bacterium]|nr:ribosome-associated translation inhibitor RaiA [Pseudomonadota bacterium]
MTVRIHGRNMAVPESIKEIAEDQVRHAARIFDDGGSVDIEFTEHQNPRLADERYRVEITSKAAGHIVRIEAEAPEARSALDLATDKYERQLRRLKERLIQRNRVGNKGLNQTNGPPDEEEDRGAGIVRTKRFLMKPMTAEEAALQMEMLGHEFFFFLDADSNQHCVVYNRRDGNVGLIEPE